MKYPTWSCKPCGVKHGTKGHNLRVLDWCYGRCEVCGKNNYVIDPQVFGGFVWWFDKKSKAA